LHGPIYPQAPLYCKSASKPIHAELAWSDTATACGIAVRSSTPVLALCRKLIEAGHDPDRPMQVWRGPVLCLHVRSIGEAANLEINGHGTGFKVRHKGDGAPPVRQSRFGGQ
jgi:hypothetical protein